MINIHHKLISLHNAQSNGHAEAAVKSMKHLLSKCDSFKDDFQKSLCKRRNSPKPTNSSPNELFFDKMLHNSLPAMDSSYQSVNNFPCTRQEETKEAEMMAKFH